MQSPTKNNPKKTRKTNTFSQVNISNNEVGFFQDGHFVMSDPNSKENEGTKNKNSFKVDRSPSRRKQTSDSALPASPPQAKKSQQPYFVDTPKKDSKGDNLLTPGNLSTKAARSSQLQCTEAKSSPSFSANYSKDPTSCSPPNSGRWAGPAFGNAPHPSSLPLPEWELKPTKASVSNIPSYSSPVQSSADMLYHSISVVPFPYVESAIPPPPSLTQLSIDLRKLLNINGPLLNDPILVTANSY